MASDDGLYTDLEKDFVDIAVRLFAPGTLAATLQRIVEMAEQTIDGCDGAGIMTIVSHIAATAAASNPLVALLDRHQIEANEGPCWDAATTRTTVYAADLADDALWPTFGPQAIASGVRCVLAQTLSTQGASALNLYAHLPSAFGATGRGQGQLFATLAGLALDAVRGRAAEDDRSANLAHALRSRELIGQAQGILMERERITAGQAFDILRRSSQHLNVKLREIAVNLVESGESPQVPESGRKTAGEN